MTSIRTILYQLWRNWIYEPEMTVREKILKHEPKIASTILPTDDWEQLSEKTKFDIRKEHYGKLKLTLRK